MDEEDEGGAGVVRGPLVARLPGRVHTPLDLDVLRVPHIIGGFDEVAEEPAAIVRTVLGGVAGVPA
ncbi:hypothetical protein [Salinifilum aidingensis]